MSMRMRWKGMAMLKNAYGVPLIVGLALTSYGCGADVGLTTPFTPTPAATPRPLVTTVVGEGSITDIQPNGLRRLSLNLTGSGELPRLEIIVDWTFASNNVDVYLAEDGACTGRFFPEQCSFVNSAGSLAKPERIQASNLTAGSYDLLIINWGTTTEAVSYQILMTQSAAAASGKGAVRVVEMTSRVEMAPVVAR